MSAPELGRTVAAAGIHTTVHDVGTRALVLLIHGSGASACSDWRQALDRWAPRAPLHAFGHDGRWTQSEHAARFNRLVGGFRAEADSDEPFSS